MKGTGVFIGPRCSPGPCTLQQPAQVPRQQKTSAMSAPESAADAGSTSCTDSCCSTPAAANRPNSVPPGGGVLVAPGSPCRRSTFPGGQQPAGHPHAAVTARHSFDQSWVGTRGVRRNLGSSSRSSPLPVLQHPPPPPRMQQQYDGAVLLMPHDTRGTASSTAHQPATPNPVGRTSYSGPLPSPTATALPPQQPAAAVGGGADAAAAAQQLLAGRSGQHRWAVVAPASNSSSSSMGTNSANLHETLLQLRARLAAARAAAGAATGLQAVAASNVPGPATGSGSLLLPVGGAGGGSAGVPFALSRTTSAGAGSADIALLLQQQDWQQQAQVALADVQDFLGRSGSGGGGGFPSSSPSMAAPYASASLMLPGASSSSPMLHTASLNALSAPVGLPAGLSVPAAAAAAAGMGVADGQCIDLAALATGAVQQKLAEMEQLEARHQQLYEEVLTLLPLV